MRKILLLLLLFMGCTVYKTPPGPKITHVLAVTAEGDTLRLPIDVIRPIYNYNNITYPRTNYYPYNYYYNHNNYKPIYKPNTNTNNNNNNNNNSKPAPRPSNAAENLQLRINKDN